LLTREANGQKLMEKCNLCGTTNKNKINNTSKTRQYVTNYSSNNNKNNSNININNNSDC